MTTAHGTALSQITAAIHIIETDDNQKDLVLGMLAKASSSLRSSVFLESKELAARWKVTPESLSNLRSRGKGPAFVRPGGAIRGTAIYAITDVEEYEKSRKHLQKED